MKTAIYIEDGTIQLVITPETDFEKGAIKSFSQKSVEAKIFTGSFYDCRGGWIRQSGYYRHGLNGSDAGDQSLILRVNNQPEKDMV